MAEGMLCGYVSSGDNGVGFKGEFTDDDDDDDDSDGGDGNGDDDDDDNDDEGDGDDGDIVEYIGVG